MLRKDFQVFKMQGFYVVLLALGLKLSVQTVHTVLEMARLTCCYDFFILNVCSQVHRVGWPSGHDIFGETYTRFRTDRQQYQ